MLSNHLIFCYPLLLLPSIFPSIRVFSNESALCSKEPKYWSFGFSPFNEYSGLISFRIDWFDLLAVQGTLKGLLQHHSFKTSILWDVMILVYWMLSFKPTFSLSTFTFIKRLFSSFSPSDIGWCHLHIWGSWYFSWQSWFQLVFLPVQCFSWCTLHIS